METTRYTFGGGVRGIEFTLTPPDEDHAAKHTTRMREWEGPYLMNASTGVDWEKVQRNFPRYSLHCVDCDYQGSDYEKTGEAT